MAVPHSRKRVRMVGARATIATLAAATVAVVTVVAGGPVSAAGTATQGVTSTSITVGGVEVVNGQGYSYADTCAGAEVYFKMVDAHGGVHGRTIKYVGCLDDGGSTTQDNSQTLRLVKSTRVFAIVPASSVFSGSSIASKANVPYFGWGITPYFCNNTQGFGFNGCTGPTNPKWTTSSWAVMLKKVVPHLKTVGIQTLDIPTTKVTAAAAVRGVKKEGLKLVYDNASIPLTGVSDYTPYVQKILQANPQALILEVQEAVPLIAALRAAGYKGATIDGVDDSAALLSNPSSRQALQGAYVVTSFSPTPNNKGMKRMRAAAKTYGAANQVIDTEFEYGYFSAALFVKMLQKVGRDLTYSSFYKVANHSGFCFNGTGAMGTVCYPAGHTNYTGCVGLVQIKGTRFVPRVPMACSKGVGDDASAKSG